MLMFIIVFFVVCGVQVPNGPEKIFDATDEVVGVLCQHIRFLKHLGVQKIHENA